MSFSVGVDQFEYGVGRCIDRECCRDDRVKPGNAAGGCSASGDGAED
jgi:hypothetical protein